MARELNHHFGCVSTDSNHAVYGHTLVRIVFIPEFQEKSFILLVVNKQSLVIYSKVPVKPQRIGEQAWSICYKQIVITSLHEIMSCRYKAN